jgi:capsular polysaccharide biosynthesis protein
VPTGKRTRITTRAVAAARRRVRRPSLAELGAELRLPRAWTGTDHLDRIEALIDESSLQVIVVIVDDRPAEVGTLFSRRYRRAQVHVLDASGRLLRAHRPRRRVHVHRANDLTAMHSALVPVAAKQVIVENGTGTKTSRTAVLKELMYHLDDGGLYVVDPFGAADKGQDVRDVLAKLVEARDDPDAAKAAGTHPDDLVRARIVGTVTDDGELVALRTSGHLAMKTRDSEVEAALPARRGPGWGRRLDQRRAQTFVARGTLHANERLDSFKVRMKVPELYVREYRDVICAPRSVVVADDLILPISFHHGRRVRLEQASEYLSHASRSFARLADPVRDPVRLPGVYYHLDSEFPWHFGHFMTEDISKLWGWSAAKQAHPDLKVLLSMRNPGDGPKAHQLTLLEAWGVAADDIVCIDAPVQVDLLIGASQMFYNGQYVHPELATIWDRLRDALRTPEPDREPTPRRIFVLRPPRGARPCRNGAEVEQLFREHGFEFVRPEQLPIQRQVDLFADAEVVAGYGGSGLFNTVYADRPGRRIVIASTEYRARNEWTIAALKGDEYHHFFCPAEHTHPEGRWDTRAFHSAFRFDFERDGAALEALLRD